MNSSFFEVDSGDVSRSGRVRKRSTKLTSYDSLDEDTKPRKERCDSGTPSAAKRKTKVMVTPGPPFELKQEVLDIKSDDMEYMSDPESSLQGYEVDGYASDTGGEPSHVKHEVLDYGPGKNTLSDTEETPALLQPKTEGDDEDDDFSNLIMVANVDDDSDDVDDGGQFSDEEVDDSLVIDEGAAVREPSRRAGRAAKQRQTQSPPTKKTAAERREQRKNASKMWKQQRMIRKDKGQPRISAYLLWAREMRDYVVQDYPDLDFSEVNKRLGAMWHALPESKKYNFKRKAQRQNSRYMKPPSEGSARMKSTGRGRGRGRGRVPAAAAAAAASEPAADLTPADEPGTQAALPPSSLSDATALVNPTNYRVCTTQPLDLAAHLVLLGESLGTIGQRLRDHDGQIAVSGSLSVLLDSLLCALVPLVALTRHVPELDGCDDSEMIRTLDNIAYFMPGL